MSEDKAKNQAEALSGTGGMERQKEGGEVESLKSIIRENKALEEALYAQRGYGGYIDTDHITHTRKTRKECEDRLAKLTA